MLTGRAFLTGVVLLLTIAELVVDDDIALPGRELDILFGVISPDRSPILLIGNNKENAMNLLFLLSTKSVP